MNHALRDYKGVICEPYIDDVLCFSKDTFEDHVMKLDVILERLEERGIKLRAEKMCVWEERSQVFGEAGFSRGLSTRPG